MPDDVNADKRLVQAEIFFAEGNRAGVLYEIAASAESLAAEGRTLLLSVSPKEFESPLFSFARRIISVFDVLPDRSALVSLFPEMKNLETAAPSDILQSVKDIYSADPKEGEAEPNTSRIEILVSILRGQQSLRDAVFAADGLYAAAASAAAPYLTAFLSATGDEFTEAEQKTESLLSGPLRRLAELFFSLLTSSLTAGILLILIRRILPFRPSKFSSAADAAFLTASHIPVIISGLRAVADELSVLRRIVRGTDETPNIFQDQ